MEPGQCWALLGRNGAGKRRLADLLSGNPDSISGQIHVLHAQQVRLLTFESQQAFYEQELKHDDTDFIDKPDPGTSVRELLGSTDYSLPPSLTFLGLEPLLDRGYRQLSSGEGRKVLLARALLDQPQLLIVEEPYDSLDQQSKLHMAAFFQQLATDTGSVPQLIFLLSSPADIAPWHTHVAVMEKGEMLIAGPREKVMARDDLLALLRFDVNKLPPWPESLPQPPLPMPLVALHKGTVRYGEKVIFEHVDLRIEPGQHTLLTGRNGSGKSTLLSLITGDHPQCYGNDLSVMGFRRGQGESIWEVKRRIGLVSPGLHRDHRVPGSALQIVLSGFHDTIGLYDRPTQFETQHALQWLALVGLSDKSGIPFKHMSHGEQRLALIARALVKQPALLLLDEPTQGLDDINRHRVMHFLEHLSSQQRSTIVMASHREDEYLPLFRHHLHLPGPF